MKTLTVALLLLATSVSAQTLLSPGAAQYPSPPLGRHFLDQPVATCVVAVPCPYGDCVILKACAPGTVLPPTQLPATPPASQLPAPVPPPVVSAPIAPTPEPKGKAGEPQEIILRIEVVPVPGTAPKVVPKPAPKKKECPC